MLQTTYGLVTLAKGTNQVDIRNMDFWNHLRYHTIPGPPSSWTGSPSYLNQDVVHRFGLSWIGSVKWFDWYPYQPIPLHKT